MDPENPEKPETRVGQRPCALVTGAGRGIGRGIALALAREGFNIVGNDISYDPGDPSKGLAGTEVLCIESGVEFAPAPGDLSDLSAHPGILGVGVERFGHIDLLVNNAGVAPLERLDFLKTTPESFDRVLGVNLRGTFFLTQTVARRMVEQVAGDPGSRPCIIFITSVSVDTSSPSRAEYGVSKAGLSHLARVCAHRLASDGITVYEIRPGLIHTDMTAGVQEKYDALIADGLVPQERWGEPEDVGRAVAALARGDFAYSTGGIFEVSGGMNIKRL
jgi:NAD(P)-dependent dehydrogenase (short-subunit alcohol dehydrogenase family)